MCHKPCSKPGDESECKKDGQNRVDENGCLFEVCYTRGTCGPLMV